MTEKPSKLALVTGGLRRLGAHIAGHLAENGYALALHGHSDDVPEAGLAQILKDNNSDWLGVVADFNVEGSGERLLDMVIAHFGRAPDLLVNNASLFHYDNKETLQAAALESHLRINMMLPTLLTTLMAKRMADGQKGAVINIVDQRVRNPVGDQLSYTLSKQALAESIRTLALACADTIRVNGVAPGLTIPTDAYQDDQMERLKQLMPLGTLSSPDDIAAAVQYLAEAKNVTGQTLFVDGGAHMKSYDRDFMFLAQR
ncbi:MAG: SDR family oxidoreductase [Parasphingorhabdus sp.]|uniref:SDR family oxidoreductase n=1 Tax=Parasphingorhabdus sp. TaxID=2709688 RepID=UPI00329A1A9A